MGRETARASKRVMAIQTEHSMCAPGTLALESGTLRAAGTVFRMRFSTSVCPRTMAICTGVSPLSARRNVASGAACSSSAATSSWPFWAARYRGVAPLYCRANAAPGAACSSCFVAAASPQKAATCSGVRCALSEVPAVVGAALSKASRTAVWRLRTARCAGVTPPLATAEAVSGAAASSLLTQATWPCPAAKCLQGDGHSVGSDEGKPQATAGRYSGSRAGGGCRIRRPAKPIKAPALHRHVAEHVWHCCGGRSDC